MWAHRQGGAQTEGGGAASTTPADDAKMMPPPSKRPKVESKCQKVVLHKDAQLGHVQRRVLEHLVSKLDTRNTSLVITNPLAKDNPIVYVTEPWQQMCGFTYDEAVNRNPRVTQGPKTDAAVVNAIGSALRVNRACKVQLVNYRHGQLDQPFWNMISINPILFQGQLMLYMANLQDYSYQMGQMVSLTPSQFCRAALHHQRTRRPENLVALTLAKPTLYETDPEHALVEEPPSRFNSVSTPLPVKRLGWSKLTLDPEHLRDRVVDALQQMDVSKYEVHERADGEGEVFMISVQQADLAFRALISEDADGHFRISCTRVAGDTFAYHAAFKLLRQYLGEAVPTQQPAKPQLLAASSARPS